MLTPVQLRGLNLDPGTADDRSSEEGRVCRWYGDDGHFDVVVILSEKRDLDLFYRNHNFLPYFVPIVVAGYPGLILEEPSAASCAYVIGLDSKRGMSVRAGWIGRTEDQDYCALVEQVAGMVIGNLASR